ncbi:MAG: RsmD family RNA methyltransferase, partial [Coriobacteriaceae bacterium]|nr:RsmD family RNA methyltransferase [Coriobacteriaceae bacterium]
SLRNADILKHPPCDQRKPFDLVFLDPPYAYAPTRMLALLNAMAGAGSLLPGAFVCYEYARSADRAVQEAFEPLQWEPVSNKGYGDTSVRLFRLGNEMPA